MPRHGRTRSRKAFHHKGMHSPAHGNGRDSKRRLRKREDGDRRAKCGDCGKPEKTAR